MPFTSDLVRARNKQPGGGGMLPHDGSLGVAAAGHGRAAGGSTALALGARGVAVAVVCVVGVWVAKLGGVALTVDVASDGAISTDRLFNLHPVLMTLAFALFMTEALLAYRSPWQAGFSRPQRKQAHFVCHGLAVLCALGGFLAAWKSHTLKQPPVPNLYSPHSYLGVAALLMMLGQFGVGLVSYLWPTIPLERRAALGPFHRFWGLATWGAGMLAIVAGLQEKATFLQAFGKKGVYSAFVALPAATELLVLGLLLAVLYLYAQPGAAKPPSRPAVAYSAVAVEEGISGGGL